MFPGPLACVSLTRTKTASASDYGAAEEAVTVVWYGGGDCEGISETLMGATWWEWVGYYDGGNAWADEPLQWVGFQYEYIDDVGLWAHEGAHLQGASESTAQGYQVQCDEPH
jgi:hypothetical protein